MKKLKYIVVSFILATAFGLTLPAVSAQTQEQKCNCVLYARSLVPSLPTGLTDWSGKVRIINHLFPRRGAVAIIDVSNSTGHVAVVENVTVRSDGSLSVSIVEANYNSCQITRRTGSVESLRIRGFYDPDYARVGSYPQITSPLRSTVAAGQEFSITFSGAGFEPNSIRAVVLGGWCDTFDKCVIPTDVIRDRRTGRVTVPMILNETGTYTVYLFNANNGMSSNGAKISVR